MTNIQIPYKFDPRPYQLDLLAAIDSGYKRAIAVYHRRAGKDKTLFNLMVKKALERVGVYYYFFPEFSQGRRVIWDGIDGSGMRFRDHVPEFIAPKQNSTDMKIELINGSLIQIVGTDKFDKVRGANPVGCVFSEYAFQNPAAWNVVRPILNENGGWAVFNSTPFGKNHFYDLLEMAKKNPKWFAQVVTVEDSVDSKGVRYISEEMVQEERDSGLSEEVIDQEYYCSFTANSEGFYYLKYMEEAEKEGRICSVPHFPEVKVDTWWDIGFTDSTAIWFTQTVGREVHVIDFYQANSRGLDHYAKVLQNKPYIYGSHNFPHDMDQSEFGTGKSALEQAYGIFANVKINLLPKLGRQDGINAARIMIPKCRFDAERCEVGIKALQSYHREWDGRRQEFKNEPAHDWSSHPADAFRYFAIGHVNPKVRSRTAERMNRFRKQHTNSWKAA